MPIEIDHIQVTVSDMERAEPFCDKLMEILGFDLSKKITAVIPEYKMQVAEYLDDEYDFGICSPLAEFEKETIDRRKPGAVHHIAFKAYSRAHVDELYEKVREIGADIIDAPQIFPQHSPNYYAFFFFDTERIKYEVVFDEPAE